MKTNPNDSINGATIEPAEKGIRVNLTNNLTKLEYFAAMALQGIISTRPHGVKPEDVPLLAADSLLFADALIAELNAREA